MKKNYVKILVMTIVMFGVAALCGCNDTSAINMIKRSSLSSYPDSPIGKTLDNYCSEWGGKTWTAGKPESKELQAQGITLVNCSGTFNYQGTVAPFMLQFQINKKTGMFGVTALELDGQWVEQGIIDGFLEIVFGSAQSAAEEAKTKTASKSAGKSKGKGVSISKAEDFQYELTKDNFGVKITGIKDVEKEDIEKITVPALIEDMPVREIEHKVFDNCINLKSVELPDSLTSVGGFAGCSALKTITIPAGVTYVGDFTDCTSLESVNLPDSVNSIGLFDNCTSLKSIDLPNSITSLGSFTNCTSLVSIKIPESVTMMGGFAGCTSLKSIEIPDSVRHIEEYYLQKYAGSGKFEGCTSLESVKLPSLWHVVGGKDFFGCTSLKSVNLAYLRGDIEEYSIDEYLIGSHAFEGCTSLKSITLPASDAVRIMSSAFKDCSSLEEVIIPSTVQRMRFENNTFEGCTSLPLKEKAKLNEAKSRD